MKKAVAFLSIFVAIPSLSLAEMPQHTETCVAVKQEDIAVLFDRWNEALKTGDPLKVVANYAPKSVLLPTLSGKARFTAEEKAEYFRHFLENQPEGRIDSRTIEIDCNTAIDEGLYTFVFRKTGAVARARYTFTYKWDGKQWLITSHHSSKLPSEQTPLDEPVNAVTQHAEVCVAVSEKEIDALLERWKDSIKSGNPHKVMTHYAPKSVLLPLSSMKPRLTLDDKEEYFRHFLKNKPLVHIKSHTTELDCNTAISEGFYTYIFEKTGTIVNARYSMVFKWDGLQWLITSHHSSVSPN
ncbi:MAG: SgcJ/EcaC family oxidoreductase [Nitrospira sp.]|nr:SgcJ/EcaC family oxidoreductase [Nitrospira sp.]MCP9442671.1 SgcJ/EcaC family oxidoreductase [Nitrospira sp.]